MRDWYVIQRRDKHLSPAAATFRAFLRREAAPIVERAVALPSMRKLTVRRR